MHSTGSAIGSLTTNMGASEIQILSDEMHEKRAGLDIFRNVLTVNFDRYLHASSSGHVEVD
jgi:hypothetical protein